MPIIKLREVFGIYREPPPQTYVDRGGLDHRVPQLLDSGRHLVIYGPSKQGKTALRKHAIPDEACVVIHCRRNHTCLAIYTEILGRLGVKTVAGIDISKGRKFDAGVEVGGGLGIPFVAKGEAKAKGGVESSHAKIEKLQALGEGPQDLHWVARKITDSKKRVIIEDFHYLPNGEKKLFAADLKALFEMGVPLILIGVWNQPQLFVTYNGELEGRIEEISLQWEEKELREVIRIGQRVLNVSLSTTIIEGILDDASGNVGLVQWLADRLCQEAGITRTVDGDTLPIEDFGLLAKAREYICQQVAVKYRNFATSIANGFADSTPAAKRAYLRLIQAYVGFEAPKLIAGIHQDEMVQTVREIDEEIPEARIKQLLHFIDDLQVNKNIAPIVATFEPVNRIVHLADRNLIFYRKYGNPVWPWELENGQRNPQ